MIKHVVFFKFKPESAIETRKDALDALRALPAKIDVIRSFEVGENVVDLARAWDAVLIGEYDDLAALDVYTKHPDHQAVVLMLREICEGVGSVDYEF